MKRLMVAATLMSLALATPAFSQANVTAGGITFEVCVTAGAANWAAVTASVAYAAGNLVGGLVTVANAYRGGTGPYPHTGILQSIRLTFLDAQTSEFDVYQFSANPTGTTWTDKATPSIAAADVTKVRPPIKLSNPSSGLGTHTVYGSDAIARASVGLSANDYFAIISIGAPTFGATNDATFCATYLQD